MEQAMEWFRSIWARIAVAIVSWESAIAEIKAHDSRGGKAIRQFYELCL